LQPPASPATRIRDAKATARLRANVTPRCMTMLNPLLIRLSLAGQGRPEAEFC
jgi:hypothetical protein